MNILAIIPARGGSKGVKNKNIIDLNGKPLIHYTINEAEKVDELKRIVVSTESNLIKSVCDEVGDYIPFLRPDELAQDASRTIDVVEHLINTLKKDFNEDYDYVCLLQPTSPLRLAQDIKNSIDLMMNQKKGSVISLAKIDEPHPNKMKVIENGLIKPLLTDTDSSVPRQELPAVYELNGAIYLCETKALMKNRNFFCEPSTPYIMPAERSANINNHFDLKLAEYLLAENLK